MTLTTLDQRGKNKNAMAGIVVEDHVEHALLSILYHLLASGVAVGSASTGKEQSHVVVNLGSGANGGAGVLIGSLLLDADDGREACNLIDIGALHATQEVAGIGREGLDITALTLGKDGIEGQR